MRNFRLDSGNLINHSYVLGIIRDNFNYEIYDIWGSINFQTILKLKLIKKKFILILDDEVFETETYLIKDQQEKILNKLVEILIQKDCICIVKTEFLYNYFKNQSINVIFEPNFDNFEVLIPLRNIKTDNTFNDSYSYCCLNRSFNQPRQYLIDKLEQFDLTQYGYVTTHYGFNTEYNQDSFILKNFNLKTQKPDRVYSIYNNLDVTLTTKNFIHILNNIPGIINISVESSNPKNHLNSIRSISEKSIQPYFCLKLPIVIGHKNTIRDHKNEGLDVFDDIIDHSYDEVDYYDYQNKVDQAISKNVNILKDITLDDNLKKRLIQNQNYLVYGWLDKKLNDFMSKIQSADFKS